MKQTLFALSAAVLLFACGAPKEEKSTEEETTAQTEQEETPTAEAASISYFGEEITADGAIQASEVAAKILGNDSVNLKVAATVDQVCQKKGCWMTVQLDEGQEMRVRFKDYGFFMPLDCAGKEVIFEGKAFADTTTVDDLRHYAEDAGKSPEEIEAITEPEINLGFLAHGVLMKEDGE